jgi:hypothetical protein
MAVMYVSFLALLFLTTAPGIYLALTHRRLAGIPPYMVLVWGLTIDAVIGYILFWTYFLSPAAGTVASWLIMAASTFVAFHVVFSRTLRARILCRDFLWPLALMALTGMLYLSALYVCPKIGSNVIHSNYRFFQVLPQDNYLPMIVAQSISHGQHPGIVAPPDWRSSDRPPLQSGLYMITLPLEILTQKKCELQYELVGVALQCFWIPAVWALCCALKLRARTIAVVLCACIFTGFMLCNSVFVWPKLLSAALGALALAIVLKPRADTEPQQLSEFALAATAGTLGMLSHAGVAFTYPAIAFVAYRNGFLRGWKRLLLGIAIFLMWTAPWSAYQKFYDPPGNRLTKWHLAGAIEPDDRTLLEALIYGYGHLTFSEYAHNKWENTKALNGPDCNPVRFFWPTRSQQFYDLTKTFGILNIGWFVLAAFFIKHKRSPETAGAARLAGIAAISVLVWVFALFNPGSTILPGGSYATVLFGFVALSVLVAQLPAWAVGLTLAVEVIHFFLTWVVLDLPEGQPLLPSMLAACVVFSIGISIMLINLARQETEFNKAVVEPA